MADRSFVEVPPDSTGKQIANLKGQAVLSDGTTATVYFQMVGLVDSDGNVQTIVTEQLRKDFMDKLTNIERLLAVIAQQPVNAA